MEKDRLEVGIDEAGRGPLFGPVYTAAVIFPQDEEFLNDLIVDSKKLTSHRKRLMAYDYVKENAIDYSIFAVDEKMIDKLNIFHATYWGTHRALDKLTVIPEHILMDGNKFKPYDRDGEYIPHTCVVKGDNKYTSIAAASILAKVERDLFIENICDKYPILEERYNMRNNKGYGTKDHMSGIEKYGVTDKHRFSYKIVEQYSNLKPVFSLN
jgi:ribonuclease HII|tara:strand:+ start:3250 stop:3882 length:633 start_codon:yes stop_codon:yes gene_type:complete